jgi:hypothetical protein
MVYYGGTKKARYISSLVAQNQGGGGDKKAGRPYEIGKTASSYVAIEPHSNAFYRRELLGWRVKPMRPQWVSPSNFPR